MNSFCSLQFLFSYYILETFSNVASYCGLLNAAILTFIGLTAIVVRPGVSPGIKIGGISVN